MNTALELHDSILASVERRGADVLVVLFPAYVHRSVGEAGFEPGTGWIHEAHLLFHSGEVSGTPPDCPMGISEGSLTYEAGIFDNCLPVPIPQTGAVTLSITLFTASRLKISGRQLTLSLLEPGVFLEAFAGL